MIRREYLLRGVVQGVGFRPHVAATAARHPITGLVGNDATQVFVEVQGGTSDVEAFMNDVLATLPPLAHVLSVASRPLPVASEDAFVIVPSRPGEGARTFIPPDVATCPDCLADMADPANRRFRYPFTTCTNCGPRLSIIESLPYDRPATTMKDFELCAACRAEYTDPGDRRHHAQPISCHDCGPRLWLAPTAPAAERGPGPRGRTGSDAVLAEAIERLRRGEILAVKGLGGFHLMCDARNGAALGRLRDGKRRSGKPFAVLVRDLDAARALALLTDAQADLLASPAHPIVIAPKGPGYDLADDVAPGLDDVGLFLPYTPLHTLLLASGLALVATSGNLSEEPLCFTNSDAAIRLSGLCDAFLFHDRGIHVPVEDSVVLASAGTSGVTIPLRRSRGYSPLPVPLPPSGGDGRTPTVLAVGGELKNTFALVRDDLAVLSAHLGDMGSLAAQEAFGRSVTQAIGVHGSEPEVVVCDLHPGYATTTWAERYADAHPGVVLHRVQHHHAHALALLAEQGIAHGPAVVAALDGTGFGTDGTIWGGEVLVLGVDPLQVHRAWHLPSFPLAGGDRAIRQPWRASLGLASAWGIDLDRTHLAASVPQAEWRLVASQVSSGVATVATSSAGRLFDAAAALLGVCLEIGYEAQAAMELERAATRWAAAGGAVATPTLDPDADSAEALRALVVGLLDASRPVEQRAWAFHAGLAEVIAHELAGAAVQAGTIVVGLTGGVALNRLFTAALADRLSQRGLRLRTHSTVPPNDGGLSLGQAWAGRLLSR